MPCESHCHIVTFHSNRWLQLLIAIPNTRICNLANLFHMLMMHAEEVTIQQLTWHEYCHIGE